MAPVGLAARVPMVPAAVGGIRPAAGWAGPPVPREGGSSMLGVPPLHNAFPPPGVSRFARAGWSGMGWSV